MNHFLINLTKRKILIGNPLVNEVKIMAKSTDLPTTAALMRFSINPDNLPEGLEIWMLNFPFGDAVLQYKTKVENRIKDKV